MTIDRSVGWTFAAVAATLAIFVAAQAPGHEAQLRKLIMDAAQGRVDYRTLTPALADAVRPQAGVAQSELTALGPLKSVRFMRFDDGGGEIYLTTFEHGALDWAFAVDAQGRIANAKYRPSRSGPL